MRKAAREEPYLVGSPRKEMPGEKKSNQANQAAKGAVPPDVQERTEHDKEIITEDKESTRNKGPKRGKTERGDANSLKKQGAIERGPAKSPRQGGRKNSLALDKRPLNSTLTDRSSAFSKTQARQALERQSQVYIENAGP